MRDRKVVFDIEPIDPPVIFLPPRLVALRVRAQGQVLLGEPLTIFQGALEDELRYGGSGRARGLHYDAFIAGDRETLVEALPAAERIRYFGLPDLPTRIADLAHKWTDSVPSTYHRRPRPSRTTCGKEIPVRHQLAFGCRRGNRSTTFSSSPTAGIASSSPPRWRSMLRAIDILSPET